ncbi:hypothetical protein BCD48_10470 [Pseudofrankia sp. BMG5.36]|nr:hypothetical protein BCD48_10470 [Pseudofrankia sp. BMG5.36]
MRRMATVGIVGAAATVAAAVFVQTVVVPESDESTKMFSYPFWSRALFVVSPVYALLHVLVLVGVLGFVRCGAAGPGRDARVGGGLVLGGLGVFTAAELASIPVRGDRVADTGAILVSATFALAMLLGLTGYLLLAVATARAGRWTGWPRRAPLVAAVGSVVVLVMSPSSELLPSGVAVWAVGQLILCAATYTDPAPAGPATAKRGAEREVRLP